MSELIVKVSKIDKVESHPDADKLDLFTIRGWKIIANKKEIDGNLVPRYSVNDLVVFVPPDAILPLELSDKMEITKYLAPVKENGQYIGGRVKAIRLRGQPSYGCMFEAPEGSIEGDDVAAKYGITKWEPPLECKEGDAERPDAAFLKYTSIENIGNYPQLFSDGEDVVFTEKTHGMNERLGKIYQLNDNGEKEFIYMAGSHGVRRKEYDADGNRSMFWEPLTENMKKLLDHLCEDKNNVIVYGEIFGSGIQDMTYGQSGRSFIAFDINVNGNFIDFDEKVKLFSDFNIPMVPTLYKGPFSMEKVEEFTSGPTTICDPSKAGKFKGREGIVIVPVKERTGIYKGNQGRVILKSISVDYLARKGATDSH
jgi:RNA ligase (TIGR02306 family)